MLKDVFMPTYIACTDNVPVSILIASYDYYKETFSASVNQNMPTGPLCGKYITNYEKKIGRIHGVCSVH